MQLPGTMSRLEPASVIAADVAAGRKRAVEICEAALQRIAATDPDHGAFLHTCRDHALQRAAAIDADVAAGRPVGPLAGVPIAVKDNICTRLAPTTCGSRILAGYQPPYDATVVRRIESAGGVIVGKTNMDEFAMGSSTELCERPTRNPWNRAHVSGGSSGGSAVAIAAGMTPLAIGSDTGGSIRQPASFCGVVGMKPTYGAVSRYGLAAYGSSLDQIGPLAANVSDAALLLSVLAGRDAADSTCVDFDATDLVAGLVDAALAERGRAMRIGLPREYFGDGLDAQVRATVDAAVGVLTSLGARVSEVSLPHTSSSIAIYYLVAMAECSSNLARYDGVRYGRRAGGGDILDLYSASRSEGFGPEVKRRIMLGTFALSSGYYDAYYLKALRARRLVKQDFDAAFERVDVICCPVAPTPAFRLGEKLDDPLAMYLADIYTNSANLAGLPGISVPCGFSDAGLPIGLQIMGPAFGDRTVLQAARLYERETDWSDRHPPGIPAAG
jgi:aspartyl-tRNA(Asn)/glutamyl-tRNA(Gln) amidotransferase subunit A